MRRKLTDEQRRALREKILRNKPWEKSTGPRTFLGKKISSQNALKHGLYSRWFAPGECREFAKLMRQMREMTRG